jgi:type I restriction enzyme R subunit
VLVDKKAKYVDWNEREDIKAALKFDLIMLLADHSYPPVDIQEVYQAIFEQAENFKHH